MEKGSPAGVILGKEGKFCNLWETFYERRIRQVYAADLMFVVGESLFYEAVVFGTIVLDIEEFDNFN